MRIGQPDFETLERTAISVGLSPRDLLARVVKQVLRPGAVLTFLEQETTLQRLSVMEQQLRAHAELLERVIPATSQSSVVVESLKPDIRRSRPRPSRPRARLHEEIIAVLEETGSPLTSAQIAERIRQRGVFHRPRSKRPLDVMMVASRIANQNYRYLFAREDGFVKLAGDGASRGPRSR